MGVLKKQKGNYYWSIEKSTIDDVCLAFAQRGVKFTSSKFQVQKPHTLIKIKK